MVEVGNGLQRDAICQEGWAGRSAPTVEYHAQYCRPVATSPMYVISTTLSFRGHILGPLGWAYLYIQRPLRLLAFPKDCVSAFS